MAKQCNRVPTEQLRLSTTPQIKDYLDQLVATGFYGKNPAEAAERVLAEAIRDKLLANQLNEIERDDQRPASAEQDKIVRIR